MSKFIVFSFFRLIVIVCICTYMCHGASARSREQLWDLAPPTCTGKMTLNFWSQVCAASALAIAPSMWSSLPFLKLSNINIKKTLTRFAVYFTKPLSQSQSVCSSTSPCDKTRVYIYCLCRTNRTSSHLNINRFWVTVATVIHIHYPFNLGVRKYYLCSISPPFSLRLFMAYRRKKVLRNVSTSRQSDSLWLIQWSQECWVPLVSFSSN